MCLVACVTLACVSQVRQADLIQALLRFDHVFGGLHVSGQAEVRWCLVAYMHQDMLSHFIILILCKQHFNDIYYVVVLIYFVI